MVKQTIQIFCRIKPTKNKKCVCIEMLGNQLFHVFTLFLKHSFMSWKMENLEISCHLQCQKIFLMGLLIIRKKNINLSNNFNNTYL